LDCCTDEEGEVAGYFFERTAKNIDLQYPRRRQNADDGGAPVDVRLNRGTLNASGEYDLPALSEAESALRYGSYRVFQRYLCKDCSRMFNDKTGTVFEHSTIPLRHRFTMLDRSG
jgi:hypothetical protein